MAITLFFVPRFGYFQEQRNIVYGMGYCGHGVALSTSAGLIIYDLLFEEKSELTQLLFVNNPVGFIPPEPFRYILVNLVKDSLRFYDYLSEQIIKG